MPETIARVKQLAKRITDDIRSRHNVAAGLDAQERALRAMMTEHPVALASVDSANFFTVSFSPAYPAPQLATLGGALPRARDNLLSMGRGTDIIREIVGDVDTLYEKVEIDGRIALCVCLLASVEHAGVLRDVMNSVRDLLDLTEIDRRSKGLRSLADLGDM